MSMPTQPADMTPAEKGTVPLEQVTAVLIKGSPNWTKITPGTFYLCEINLNGTSNRAINGSIGFRFNTIGAGGKNSVMFVLMDAIAAIQVESTEPSGGNNVNNNK